MPRSKKYWRSFTAANEPTSMIILDRGGHSRATKRDWDSGDDIEARVRAAGLSYLCSFPRPGVHRSPLRYDVFYGYFFSIASIGPFCTWHFMTPWISVSPKASICWIDWVWIKGGRSTSQKHVEIPILHNECEWIRKLRNLCCVCHPEWHHSLSSFGRSLPTDIRPCHLQQI